MVTMSPSEMEKEDEEAGAADHHSMFHLWGYKNPFAAILILTLIIRLCWTADMDLLEAKVV